jgi:ectoine hydroxylase-related dioxygenase (phytanoyl-CoA dioxygenase family)
LFGTLRLVAAMEETMNTFLSEAQLDQYQRDGFCLIDDVLSSREIASIQQRLAEYVTGARDVPETIAMQVEPKVARGEASTDESDPMARIRKIDGTVPADELITQSLMNSKLIGGMRSVLGPNLKLYRCTFLMKPPFVGSAKGVHQDSPYWPIEPFELASCWIALDDATEENGCMQVIPGSHDRAIPHVDVLDDKIVPDTEYDASTLIPVEMKAGTGLLFHSLLLHGTAPNTSSRPRRAVTVTVMPSNAHYTGGEPKPDYYRVLGRDVLGGV